MRDFRGREQLAVVLPGAFLFISVWAISMTACFTDRSGTD
jgi:hypothetical protein